jgi:hypothetical protein
MGPESWSWIADGHFCENCTDLHLNIHYIDANLQVYSAFWLIWSW